ncbi:MAG: SDR family oxidoreductase [Bacteroidales bacterium]|nr:SDR family oxidoreductase [Bacteroidales bacterium]
MTPKTICITGATAGIGQATAKCLAKEGHRLIVIGRREKRLKEFAEVLRKEYMIDCLAISIDIRSREEVQNAIGALPAEWRAIDVLINNAGLAAGLDPVHKASLDDWDQMIDTNVKGLLFMSRLISPGMVDRGEGHIINIGSIAGKEVYSNASVYCATKHAVDALSKGMRQDLLPYGIKVTAVHPGAVDTEFSTVRFKGDQERVSQVYKGFEPLRAEDIAETILFALSRPPHVNIDDILIMPSAQASATQIRRK